MVEGEHTSSVDRLDRGVDSWRRVGGRSSDHCTKVSILERNKRGKR